MTTPGIYYGKVVEAVTGEAGTGKPQLVATFAVTHHLDEQNNAWLPAEADMQRRMYLSLADGAWPYTQGKLELLGFSGDFENPQFGKPAQKLLCRHDEYQGRVTEKWELADYAGGEVKPASTDVKKRLGAKWRATADASRPATPVPAVPLQAEAVADGTEMTGEGFPAPPPTGDEIPF